MFRLRDNIKNVQKIFFQEKTHQKMFKNKLKINKDLNQKSETRFLS